MTSWNASKNFKVTSSTTNSKWTSSLNTRNKTLAKHYTNALAQKTWGTIRVMSDRMNQWDLMAVRIRRRRSAVWDTMIVQVNDQEVRKYEKYIKTIKTTSFRIIKIKLRVHKIWLVLFTDLCKMRLVNLFLTVFKQKFDSSTVLLDVGNTNFSEATYTKV